MAESSRERTIKNIKTGGSMAIYIGTASIIKPLIKKHNQERNVVTRVCSSLSGTVISCGISHIASRWFGKMVDKVTEFVDDMRSPKKKEESDPNGKQ